MIHCTLQHPTMHNIKYQFNIGGFINNNGNRDLLKKSLAEFVEYIRNKNTPNGSFGSITICPSTTNTPFEKDVKFKLTLFSTVNDNIVEVNARSFSHWLKYMDYIKGGFLYTPPSKSDLMQFLQEDIN